MFKIFNKNKRIYLDYAAATPMSNVAKESLAYALSVYGNPSAIYKEGVDAKNLLNDARKKIGNSINARKHEIYFMSSGTESCNLAIMGVYNDWKKDNEHTSKLPHIIVSAIEHPAIMEPVTYLAKNSLVNVTILPVYESGIVKVNDLRQAITKETILVSVMYANNEIGTIQPIKEIGRVIEEIRNSKIKNRKEKNYPIFHTDACQASNYLNLDVFRLKVDLMTLNSNKVYGPKGVSCLYKKEEISLTSVILGGGQERNLRSGTESVPSIYSFACALAESVNKSDSESERLTLLRNKFKDELLKKIPEASFYGSFKSRLPNNINCRFPGIKSDEMIIRLDAKGFSVSHKSACASSIDDSSYVICALGAEKEEAKENIRITLGRETLWNDLEKFINEIEIIYRKYKK